MISKVPRAVPKCLSVLLKRASGSTLVSQPGPLHPTSEPLPGCVFAGLASVRRNVSGA